MAGNAALTFTVRGNPVPQPRARVTARGKFAHAYTPKAHPVHDYRKAIAVGAAAFPAMCGGLSEQPISVTIKLTFERPPSHLNKSGIKASAPRLPKPDVDNVAKAVLDAINGVAWHDDSQVAELIVRKSYGTAGATEVTIAELP